MRILGGLRCGFSTWVKLGRYEGKFAEVGKLELDNPKKKNALSVDLLSQLDASIKEINQTPSLRAVVLKSSTPGHFCAGADLKERLDKTEDQIEYIVNNLRRIFNDLRNIHCPVFCLIDGPALGGGLELALNADIRIATAASEMGLPETYWSLIPGGGGTQTLARTIGVALAKELIFTGRRVKGEDALKLGLVNHVVPTFAEAEAKALSIVEEMLGNAPVAIRHAKKAINWGSETDLRSGLEIERFNYERVLRTADRREGFLAFAEKRKPKYQGN